VEKAQGKKGEVQQNQGKPVPPEKKPQVKSSGEKRIQPGTPPGGDRGQVRPQKVDQGGKPQQIKGKNQQQGAKPPPQDKVQQEKVKQEQQQIKKKKGKPEEEELQLQQTPPK
jgi:hypothetical protein